ncbi:MAG: class I SAM-dependent methyltransferase [Planctomycetes bacterium]|nr:class I SAM-dependent methyltransferase [Planctomycetota bacterium]
MTWRGTQSASRERYLAKYDLEEVERFDGWIRQLTDDDNRACLSDIGFTFRPRMTVLDVGAGTGAMCQSLSLIPDLTITALEPSPAMLAKLRSKPELRIAKVVEGFCDSVQDRQLFDANSFDVLVSRQLVNGLFDPLAAFRNWHAWLKPGGTVIAIDGLFDRTAWTERWQEELDLLPMSACRSMAMTPYLLEQAGFQIQSVGFMQATNARPSTRTPRYLVTATKAASE